MGKTCIKEGCRKDINPTDGSGVDHFCFWHAAHSPTPTIWFMVILVGLVVALSI